MAAEPLVAVRDAASLAIVDTVNGQHFVLMGKRRKSQAFVPGKYVLPGGACEAADSLMAEMAKDRFHWLAPLDQARLVYDATGAPAPTALALAALRETAEETGRFIGRRQLPRYEPQAAGSLDWPDAWQTFASCSVIPDLALVTLLARAITPPGPPRRFDARFFHVQATAIAAEIGSGDGEFERVDWLDLDAALALDLHDVTRAVVEQLVLRLDSTGAIGPTDFVPYLHGKHGTWIVEHLSAA